MGKISKKDAEALVWLRFNLNHDTEMPAVDDWPALIAFAEKQALTGVCLPNERPVNLDQTLVLQWIGQVQLIEQRNKLLNARIGQLFEMLENAGFVCCLLKGQGNAEMYPNPLVRCSGDIDVWIDAKKECVYQYVRQLCPDAEESFKHIHFPVFKDAPVDAHTTPLRFYSRHFRKRLNRWIETNKAEQFAHKIKLTGNEKEVNVPTERFNAIYQMGHMLIHTFDEGLGLRQVVDYFYVLKGIESTNREHAELAVLLRKVGMYKFARGIMWIESQVLGLPVARCLVEPDEKLGMKLLEDILEGGNYGHHSERYGGINNFYYRGVVEAFRDLRWFFIAPREVMARLVNKMGTAWRHLIR
jgi:hypothetical protein